MLINAGIDGQGNEITPKSEHWEDILLESQKDRRFTWLEVHNATSEEILQVEEEIKLPDLVIEDIKSGGQMPKVDCTLFTACGLNIEQKENHTQSIRGDIYHTSDRDD